MARTASRTPRAARPTKAAAIPAEQVSEQAAPEAPAEQPELVKGEDAPAPEAPAEEVQPVEAPALEQAPESVLIGSPEHAATPEAQANAATWDAAFKPKRMNPAREDLLIAMAEAPDAGAKLWDEQPKARDKTKAILLDGAFVKHDGKAAAITPKGRAFATYAALHRTAEGKPSQAPKAPKAEAPKGKPGRPAKAAQVTQAVKTAPVQAAPTGQDGSKLAAIVQGIYGVNFLEAPAITLIWAATQMIEIEGKDAAKAELSALNAKREAAGKIPAYAPYGSLLF